MGSNYGYTVQGCTVKYAGNGAQGWGGPNVTNAGGYGTGGIHIQHASGVDSNTVISPTISNNSIQ